MAPKAPTSWIMIKGVKHDMRALAIGDVCDVYQTTNNKYVVKVCRHPALQSMLDTEAAILTKLRTAYGKLLLAQMFPEVVVRLTAESDKGVKKATTVFYKPDGYIPLPQVSARHPKLDGRHIAWMYKRLLTALSAAHRQGIVHGAVFPEHILINPENHGLMLIGWGQAVKLGEKVSRIAEKYRAWYPPEVMAKKPSRPGVDIYMATLTMLQLSGGDAAKQTPGGELPAGMYTFFKGALLPSQLQEHDALNVCDRFVELLEKLYGPPRFVELVV